MKNAINSGHPKGRNKRPKSYGAQRSNIQYRKRANIESQTQIVPHAIAIAVWEEASLHLKTKLPRSWITELTTRANDIYQHNRRFRQLVRQPRNRGRDWLWSFTRHWLAGLLQKHRPYLFTRLPSSYVYRSLI